MITTTANRRMEEARARYIATGSVGPDTVVRPIILESWKRSRMYGLDSHNIKPRQVTSILSEGQLTRAARPLIEEYQSVLKDMPAVLTINDADGCILDRWVSSGALESEFEPYHLDPGYSLAENVVGTCGSGISLETGTNVLVLGAEHFGASADPMASASAVVRHPITRRLVGTIALTCRIDHATPLALHWVEDQARKLQRHILRSVSTTEQLLFETFLTATRDARHPVICLNDRTIVSNAAAARVTDEVDQSTLWELAAGTVRSGRAEQLDLALPESGESLRVECEPIRDGQGTVGAVLRIAGPRKSSARPTVTRPVTATAASDVLPRLVGRSAAWSAMCRLLDEAMSSGEDILLIGAAGTGKSAIIDDLLLDRGSATRLAPPAEGEVVDRTWDERVASTLTAGCAIVVADDADRGGPQGVSAIAEALQASDSPPSRVIASMSWDGAEGASDLRVQAIEHWPGVVVKVPTLRERAGDIPLLLEALTRSVTATSHGPRWAPEALQVVSRIQWPSNVASLAKLVVTMARRVPGPVIHATDLPTDVIAMASRRQLFGLEHVEAHAIAAALKAADGNKKLAADRLGIARSTLYRKMRALGIDLTASAY